ncbi:MAG TPA: hypothetical protein PKE08_03010 [Candidatus Paceibacterota bacterium]|nr:hypothetical protein [Candidatus Paceibacterota bacterium]
MKFLNKNFLLIISILVFISIAFTFSKYVLREDFEYFLTEDELPEQFNINSYR